MTTWSDQVALVTGGARGIGRATALLLAKRGAAVCVNYTAHANAAEDLVAEIAAAGGRAIEAMADVAMSATVEAMVAQTEKELGPVTILVNNAGNPGPIDRLFGVLRSAHAVPIQLILTANPGGAGQQWLRSRYALVPFPKVPKVMSRQLPTGAIHKAAVIPSRITDNRILLSSDPGYIDRLHLVGSVQLVKSWLEGDWTAIEGAFFDCWSEARHVIEPFTIPDDWLRFRSGDWGSKSPFSFGWWAVAGDDYKQIRRGALVRYREWYGKGDKLTAEEVGRGLVLLEAQDPKLTYGVLDPSAFARDGGPSIAERINDQLYAKKLNGFTPADNARVPTIGSADRRGAMGGWDQMRSRLVGDGDVPMIFCFSTCRDSIRTIPVLQHDPMRAEDLDTKSEDHAADDWRYACMSRPWIKEKPVEEKSKNNSGYRPIEDLDDWRSDWKTF